MSHTPEPWRVCESPDDDMITCDAVDGRYMVYCTRAGGTDKKRLVSEQEQEANARRIVACVNACAGSTNEELTLIADMGGFDAAAVMRWEQVRELVQQHEQMKQRMQDAIDALNADTAQELSYKHELRKAEQQRDELRYLRDALKESIALAEKKSDELQKELEARRYDIRYACDRITEHADEARKLRSMSYELQERLDRLLVSVDAAARWIRNCSTPIGAACELEMAAAKARGKA